MKKPTSSPRRPGVRRESITSRRRGIVAVVAGFSLVVLFGFVAFAVDTGRITMTQTELQNAVDAAALAASQEITAAIYEAGEDGDTVEITADSAAIAQARQMAQKVAAANGVYIDPTTDVRFGKRSYNATTGEWPIVWDQGPFNAVKVTARRNNPDTAQPDGALRLAFGWAVARPTVDLAASSTAFVESRDLVLVLDYSASMNDDSEIASFSRLGQSDVEKNLDEIWQALVDTKIKWPGTSHFKFPPGGLGKINSAYGTYVSSDSTSTILDTLNLDEKRSDGSPKHPFPQAGKSGGVPRNMPSYSTSVDRWEDYIKYVKNLSGTYRKRYGYRTLVDYLLTQRPQHHLSEDLWRTPHYPAHAVKNGASLFLNFLDDLDFGDEVGLVIYDTEAYAETTLADEGVNLSSDPITNDYSAINKIQRRKQAGNEEGWTGMGYGIREGRKMLANHGRYGARPMMLVMTDGQTNQRPGGWSPPGDWNWAELTDYDNNGSPNYTTSDRNKQYAFWEAREAIKAGITIHTMSVGEGADVELMKAIAFAGGGIHISVPGGTTIKQLESQVLEAFAKIAAKVPPGKLVYDFGQ